MVSPNALKLLLPQSNSQVQAKAIVSVSIRRGDPFFYLDGSTHPMQHSELETALRIKLVGKDDPTISLHADKYCTIEEMMRVMNIAKDNKWKIILATSPEDKK
jgi:biopolymer transport protein ExbD